MKQPTPADSQTTLRVLLLEDDPNDAALLEYNLMREGFALHVDRVDTRDEFLGKLSDDFDLILSDHALPQFNAIQALELVRERDLDVPFIIVSGAISEETAVEALRRGAADYLLKDRPARLGQAIRNALQERQHRVEKARAVEAIRRSEALKRSVLDSIPAQIAVLNRSGRIIAVNEAWESFAIENGNPGLDQAGVCDNYVDVCRKAAGAGDEAAQRALEGIEAVLDGRQNRFTMAYAAHSPGAQRWFEMRVSPLVGAEQGGAVVVHTDITERQMAHEALRESEERWRVLFEHNPVAVLITQAGAIEYCNPAAARLFGADDPARLTRRRLADFIAGPPEVRAEAGMEAEREPGTDPVEYRIVDLGGNERVVEASSVPVTFRRRRVIQTVLRDLTDQRRYEQHLIEAKERAEEMSRLKSTFLANMSHEIRTPLTSILGFAEILASSARDDDEHFARMIQKSGMRLMETLNSVLDLAQLEGRAIVLRPTVVDLVALVQETLPLFGRKLREAGLSLTTQLPAGPVYVLADRAGLDRVLANLLSNAIKFTRQGGITLTVDQSDESGRLHVADTGIGIAPDFLPRLFTEFQQESSGLGRDFEGNGLGLAITHRLVSLMDGAIRVVSEKGKGSTFTVQLPLAGSPRAQAGPQAEVEAEPSPLLSSIARTVLVAEDNAETRTLFDHLLRTEHRAQLVGTAAEALDRLRQDRFDLVILDVNLGGPMTGEHVLGELRTLPHYRDVPVIACTGYALPGDADRFLKAGFDAYLPKPFTKDQLFAAIESVSRDRDGRAQAPPS